MGGWEAGASALVEPTVKYHSFLVLVLTPEQAGGKCQVGSLTGAVASKRVTEAPKGSLKVDGNHLWSALAKGSLTVRPTSRAGAKAGQSDPTVPSGRAVA